MSFTTKTIMAAIMITGHVCAMEGHHAAAVSGLKLFQGGMSLREMPTEGRESIESPPSIRPIEFKLGGISGFNPDEPRRFATIIFGRHFPTDANKAEKANGDAGIVSGDSLSSEDLVAWQTMALRFRFSLIMSAITERHYATARALAEKTSQACLQMSCFNEQKLGELEGGNIKEIMSNSEFDKMLRYRDYKIPGGGESGNEVIERLRKGIMFVLEQLSYSTPAESLAYICTSRCSMNWLLRYLLDDYSFLQLKIPNCGMFIVRYFPDTRELQLCNKDAILPESTKELHDMLKKYEINPATEAERWEREYVESPRCKTPVLLDERPGSPFSTTTSSTTAKV